MCHTILQDVNFIALLLFIDNELAEKIRLKRCPHCGSVLHRANYPRKPQGSPLIKNVNRFSFCCSKEGCRKRQTPPSVRFLGRKVYVGAMVVLATYLQQGGTERRLLRLQKLLSVSRRTLRRWKLWWQETFARSSFWSSARGLFSSPVAEQNLPTGLLMRMGFAKDASGALIRMLKFLAPITCGAGLDNQAK